MINFDEIELTKIEHFKGGDKYVEARMVIDNLNKIMKSQMIPGSSVGMHKHETSSEIIFILKGTAKFILDGKEEIVKEGQCHYCKKGSTHTMINIGEDTLEFFAVVPEQ